MEPVSEPEPDDKLLNQNIECKNVSADWTLQQIINHCVRGGAAVIIQEEIGKGNYGIVYKGIYRSKAVAIKHIHKIKQDNTEEYDFTRKMSDANVGPKLYHGFYFRVNGKLNQVLITELFDIGCFDIIVSDEYSVELKVNIVRQMIYLIKEMLKHGLVCLDIKLDNFVYRFSDNTVKMIDFGEFCSTCPSERRDCLGMYCYILLLQLKYSIMLILIYFFDGTNEQFREIIMINQIFLTDNCMPQRGDYSNIVSYLNRSQILNLSFTHNTFNMFTNHRHETNINEDGTVSYTVEDIRAIVYMQPMRVHSQTVNERLMQFFNAIRARKESTSSRSP